MWTKQSGNISDTFLTCARSSGKKIAAQPSDCAAKRWRIRKSPHIFFNVYFSGGTPGCQENFLRMSPRFLSPQSSPFADRVIHTVLHGHYFLNRNTFKYRHFHFASYPEIGINTQNQKCNSCHHPDHVSLHGIFGDVQDHIYRSCNPDQRKQRTAGYFKWSRCLWKSVP